MDADVQLFCFCFVFSIKTFTWYIKKKMYTATFPVHIKFRIKRKAVPSCLLPRLPLRVLPRPPSSPLGSGSELRIKWVPSVEQEGLIRMSNLSGSRSLRSSSETDGEVDGLQKRWHTCESSFTPVGEVSQQLMNKPTFGFPATTVSQRVTDLSNTLR